MRHTLAAQLSQQLKAVLRGRICLLGVGNRDRRDDGAGSVLTERLAGRFETLVIDAGAVPENFLEKVARACPDTVLVIDAVDFGGAPGALSLLDPDDIGPGGLSSHALSLRMTVQYLRARTAADIALLAVQPADLGHGAGLSDPVAGALAAAEHALLDALPAARVKEADHA